MARRPLCTQGMRAAGSTCGPKADRLEHDSFLAQLRKRRVALLQIRGPLRAQDRFNLRELHLAVRHDVETVSLRIAHVVAADTRAALAATATNSSEIDEASRYSWIRPPSSSWLRGRRRSARVSAGRFPAGARGAATAGGMRGGVDAPCGGRC